MKTNELVNDNCLDKEQLLGYICSGNNFNCSVDEIKKVRKIILYKGLTKNQIYDRYKEENIREDFLRREPKIVLNDKIIVPIIFGKQREMHYRLMKEILEILLDRKIMLEVVGDKKYHKKIVSEWRKRFIKNLKKNKVKKIDSVIFGSTYLFRHVFCGEQFFEELKKEFENDVDLSEENRIEFWNTTLKHSAHRNLDYVNIKLERENFTLYDLLKKDKSKSHQSKKENFAKKHLFTDNKFREIFNSLYENKYLYNLALHGSVYYKEFSDREKIEKIQKKLYEKHLQHIQEFDDEFIKYQIIKFRGKVIVNFNYPYGPQSGDIVEQILENYEVNNILIYGSCGALRKEYNIQDLITPHTVKLNDTQFYFNNILSEKKDLKKEVLKRKIKIKSKGVMIGVKSPLVETISFLKNEIEIADAQTVEMELFHIVQKIKKNNFKGNLGCIYYVSDNPLENFGLGMGHDLSSGVKYGTEKIMSFLHEAWAK